MARPQPEVDQPIFIHSHEGVEEGTLVLGRISEIVEDRSNIHVIIALALGEDEADEEFYTTDFSNLVDAEDYNEEPVDQHFNRGAFHTEFVELIESREGDAKASMEDADEDWTREGGPTHFSGWAVDWSALERETGEEWWRE